MNLYILLLIVVPIVFSILFLMNNSQKYYKTLSILLCVIAATLSILLAINGTTSVKLSGGMFNLIESIVLICEILITIFLFWVSIKHKRWSVLALAVIQTAIAIYSEIFVKKAHSMSFNVDKLSLVMLLIINIIGTLIVVFSNGYISEYEHHKNLKNKQKLYYGIICLFLSAMNGLVLSDSLSLVYFFWEITTISSFVLISYNRDEEAYNSGFRALFLNLIGGICFALGNVLFVNMADVTTFSELISHKHNGSMILLPVVLLCVAGFAKSAQFPFQSWLLGAMVAPTPVSALLHSSTMVKAGVYLIVKLSPAYAGTYVGTMVAVFGAFSFLICSIIAMTQQNAKRILAYSTIANLGLIITSAGIGTSVAVSSAIILIIFHAISKALLFLCAGQIEHTIGSRDIEDMGGLIYKAPLLATITAFGIISMILPPFGVLVTKWLSIEAASQNPFVAVFLVLGSAFTTVFWVKWLCTILSYYVDDKECHSAMDRTVSVPLILLSVMVLITSIFISPIFNAFVSPEVTTLLSTKNDLSIVHGNVLSNIGSFNDFIIFLIFIVAIVIYFIYRTVMPSKAKIKNVYMCGENNSEEDKFLFRSANGTYAKANISNFYLTRVIKEDRITVVGYIISIALIISAAIGGII